MSEKADLLVQLALANSMILFNQDQVQNVVLRIFQIPNRWLSDIVMLNCRTMKSKLTGEVESKIYRYLGKVDVRTYFYRYRNVDFSLSLAREFFYLRFMHALRMLAFMSAIFVICILLGGHLASPLLFLHSLLYGTVESMEAVIGPTVICGLLAILSSLHRNVTIDDSILVFNMTAFLTVITYVLLNKVGITMTIIALIWLLINGAYYLILAVHAFFSAEDKWLIVIGGAFMVVCGVGLSLVMLFAIAVLLREGGILWMWSILTITIISLLVEGIRRKLSLRRVFSSLMDIVLTPVRFIRDGLWVRNLPKLDKLNRADLADHLIKHKTKRYRRAYVDHLVQNKVRLMGMWPDQVRPRFGDDELTYKLMKLDCAYMDNLRKPF